MTILQALILGIIQGITEFLPVSSTGHLILVPSIFNWELQNLTFDVALHLGTAFAVLSYFMKNWIIMVKSLILDVSSAHLVNFSYINKLRRDTKLFLTIILVSIPVGIAGILFGDTVEIFFRSPLLVSVMLILVSFVMLFAEKYSFRLTNKKIELSFFDSLLISLSQIVALIPGTSRSGITISTGLFRGIKREEVAKFSFLLATPVILGAAVLKAPLVFKMQSEELLPLFVGFLSSFIVGFLSIKWLLGFLKNHSLIPFAIYRIVLGVVILYNSLA